MRRLFFIWTILFSLLFLFTTSSCEFSSNIEDGDKGTDFPPLAGDDDSGADDLGDDDALGDDDDVYYDDDDDTTPVTLDLVPGCNFFSTSSECYFPYPSAFFQDPDPLSPTGVRVNYPQGTLPTFPFYPDFDMAPTNTADGVSPAGPILIHFGVDVAPEYLTSVHNLGSSLITGNPMALFNYETGDRVMFLSEMDMNRKAIYKKRYACIIRPMEPMEMGQRHIVALTKDITDDSGNPIESPPAFAVLRDSVPTTNPEIEAIRPHYEKIFAFLEKEGYQRENLLLAWDFMVASQEYLLGSVLSMREVALSESLGTGMGYAITRVEDDPNQYLARIVEGDFEVPNFLNDDSRMEYDSDHHPVRQQNNAWFEYTMVIPKKAALGEPLPLLVFGHGIFGKGRDYLTQWPASFIHEMAEAFGAIVIATDWIGLSGGDFDLIIEQIIPDLNEVSLVTDRLQQSLVNNLVMTELALGALSADPAVKVGQNDLVDTSRVYYYGVSLGGIQGSSFVSISNRIERGVLAVPGSVWLNLIPRSVVWLPMKFYLDIFCPDPLVQQLGIAIIQTRFDLSDPVNLTKLMFKAPLPDAPAGRNVVLQEAIGDSQVPNMTTEMLARAIGTDHLWPGIYDVEGLDTVASGTFNPVLAQYYMVEQAQGNMPPEENIPPGSDNYVHTDVCFLPNVMDQVVTFLETGQVIQYCNGLCDPD